jgi:cyclopropane fatty-acyl-phospholipid synthase-like methyltransferase
MVLSGKPSSRSKDVQRFYNERTSQFLEVYGKHIQAFRTLEMDDYLQHILSSIGIESGWRCLDAGCGVGGPAEIFAKHKRGLHIDAVTISDEQITLAKKRIEKNGPLNSEIVFHNLDYHNLRDSFEPNSFDCIYFLESMGHSDCYADLIESAYDLLKPGGVLFIKDLFQRKNKNEWVDLRIQQLCHEINQAYHYSILSAPDLISSIQSNGFQLDYLRTPPIPPEQFEHLSISNDFQNIFGVGQISSWDNYIFPIEFYEVRAIKPKSSLSNAHLYHMNQ